MSRLNFLVRDLISFVGGPWCAMVDLVLGRVVTMLNRFCDRKVHLEMHWMFNFWEINEGWKHFIPYFFFFLAVNALGSKIPGRFSFLYPRPLWKKRGAMEKYWVYLSIQKKILYSCKLPVWSYQNHDVYVEIPFMGTFDRWLNLQRAKLLFICLLYCFRQTVERCEDKLVIHAALTHGCDCLLGMPRCECRRDFFDLLNYFANYRKCWCLTQICKGPPNHGHLFRGEWICQSIGTDSQVSCQVFIRALDSCQRPQDECNIWRRNVICLWPSPCFDLRTEVFFCCWRILPFVDPKTCEVCSCLGMFSRSLRFDYAASSSAPRTSHCGRTQTLPEFCAVCLVQAPCLCRLIKEADIVRKTVHSGVFIAPGKLLHRRTRWLVRRHSSKFSHCWDCVGPGSRRRSGSGPCERFSYWMASIPAARMVPQCIMRLPTKYAPRVFLAGRHLTMLARHRQERAFISWHPPCESRRALLLDLLAVIERLCFELRKKRDQSGQASTFDQVKRTQQGHRGGA